MKTKQIEIQDVLHLLGEKQILSLFVRGGQTVHASFLQTKYFNEIVTYISPKLIGGKNAPTLFGGNGFQHYKMHFPGNSRDETNWR